MLHAGLAFLNLLLPDDIVCNSPSKRAGISAEQEKRYRIFTCELIQEMGIHLELCVNSQLFVSLLEHSRYFWYECFWSVSK